MNYRRTAIATTLALALTLAGCAAESQSPPASGASAPADKAAEVAAAAPASVPVANAGAASGPTIEKPPTFQKGYKLTYRSRTSVFDVTYQGEQDGLHVFHYDTREKLPYDYLYTQDMRLAGINTAQQQTTFDPPVGYVQFPLSVGEKWTTSYKGTSNSSHNMGETSCEVLSYGPLQVPYGTVNAFRIQVRTTDREVKRANPYETYYYSPEIGYYVKHETNRPIYEDPFELMSYTK
jgi:hypothetical protein